MNGDFVVRPYQAGDEKEIVELLRMVFDGWPHFDLNCSSVDHWKWKHLDKPWGESVTLVAEKGGEIIGCTHTIPLRLKIGDGVYLGGIGVDEAVHPDFRGKGVWKEMAEIKKRLETESGMAIRLGNTLSPILITHHIHSKERSLFQHKLVYMVRIKDISLHLFHTPQEKALMKKYGFIMLKTHHKLKKNLQFNEYAKLERDFCISHVRRFDVGINHFWREIKDHYTFIVERTFDYLNWRYFDPRSGEYVVRQAEGNGQVLGYSVIRFNRYRRDYSIGCIADVIALPGRFDVVDRLVADAISQFEVEKLNMVRCQVIKGHPYEKILGRLGFVDSRVKSYFSYQMYQDIDDEVNKLISSGADRKYFAYGDYDAI